MHFNWLLLMIFDLLDPSNMLLEEALGHAPLENLKLSETLFLAFWDIRVFE